LADSELQPKKAKVIKNKTTVKEVGKK